MRDALSEAGQCCYDERLRELLESGHLGEFVAIEPESGCYFLGDTGTEALVRARGEMPSGLFYLVRIGYQTTDALGSHLSGRQE